MKVLDIAKKLDLALRPKYIEMMNSAIDKIQGRNAIFCEAMTTYNKCVSELSKLGTGYDARQSKEFKDLLHLKDGRINKQNFSNSMIFQWLNKKHFKMVKASSREEIRAYYTDVYMHNLKITIEEICQEIKDLNPIGVSEGYSEHDINFTLLFKDKKSKSFTINTIVAGGDIQILHYRVLKKLHKGVI